MIPQIHNLNMINNSVKTILHNTYQGNMGAWIIFFEKLYTAVLGESAYALFYLTQYSFHIFF